MSLSCVEISERNILERLRCSRSEETTGVGFLLGNFRTSDKSSITIHSCSGGVEAETDLSILFKEIVQVLSGDTTVVGLWFRTTENVNINLIKQFCLENISNELKSLFGENLVVYALTQNDNASVIKENIFLYNCVSNEVTPVNVKLVQTCDDLLTFRITGDLPVEFTVTENSDLIKSALLQIEKLKNKIQSNESIFHINNSNVLLATDRPVNLNPPMQTNCCASEILEYIEDETDDSFNVIKSKKSKKKSSISQVIDVSLLTQLTLTSNATSPVAYFKSGLSQKILFYLPLDTVVQTNKSQQVSELSNIFITAVCKQITAMATSIQKYSTDEICIGRPFHFQPWDCNLFVTVVYVDSKADADLESVRRRLHQLLLLPIDKPRLRKCNAYRFPSDKKNNVYLENTHTGLKNDKSNGTTVHLVEGTYSYHHYMQDRFNDDKWGCAYRSLQTIVSWFRHQGYTDVPVPTHRVIQQTLVEVGDKESKFVDSRQWIGSIEVCTVLNQLLEVTSKIMCVSAGSEMANKGRELAHHFDTQGTPIMIGGGVLAHTILGVDFNEKSGDVHFLILDPHYTGSEDLKVIQDKGWCGWKGSDFWDPNVFYNLCLPQRPNVI